MNCRYCNSANTTLIYPADDFSCIDSDHFSVTKADLIKCEVSRCNECTMIFNSTDLTQLELYEDVVDEGYEETAKERQIEFSAALSQLVKDNVIELKGSRLLDVGCMTGVLLQSALDLGAASVAGVEPSRWAACICESKGLKVTNAFFDENYPDDERFDIITMFDVIEHVPDPDAFILNARRLLTDNGVLVITTPNINSIYSRVLRRAYWFIELMHLFYFTPDSLTKCISKASMQTQMIRRHKKVLRLGYAIERVGGLAPPLNRLCERVSKLPPFNRVVVSFYAGQMLLVARKRGQS